MQDRAMKWGLLLLAVVAVLGQKGGYDTAKNLQVVRDSLEIPFSSGQDLITKLATNNFSVLEPWVSPAVKGRTAPLGDFSGLAGFAEYVYGIALSFDWQSYSVYYLKAVDNMVYFRYDANGSIPSVDTLRPVAFPTTFPVTGSYTFDENGKVCAVDLNFNRYGLLLETSWMKGLNYSQVLPEMFCDGLMRRCYGDNEQFASLKECYAYMKGIKFGLTDRMDQNTVLCRQFHWVLAEYAPDVHCLHSGPNSNKCFDKKPQDYTSHYTCNSDGPFTVSARGKFINRGTVSVSINAAGR